MLGNGDGKLALGFDAGSVALKVVVTDSQGNLLKRSYVRMQGQPIEVALEVLGDTLDDHGAESFDLVAGTGSSGRLICELLGVPFANEVICQATAIRHLYPETRTLIEMGGQDSKLILLPEDPDSGQPMVDFSMNTNCAAGTGSFLDQQASRLGIRIEEEFGSMALKCQCPPRVAGRCSVFAKSDMIHLQQQGATVEDIVAGLCLGLARNLKANLGKGMDLPGPIAFCGGVAANRGVVRAIEEVFELGSGGLVVPEEHTCTGALGAVLVGLKQRRDEPDHGRPPGGTLDLRRLKEHLDKTNTIGHRLTPLSLPSDGQPDGDLPDRETLAARAKDGPIDAYLGLDVGSISTKIAVIDCDMQVLAKIYLMTAGRPMDAVQRALTEIHKQLGDMVRIRGAATTGSGRYLTGDFIGADLVINEITAQATAAAVIDPTVDTIFEIGGQDSKYISLDGGVVVDFEMNHACAAGTGSFLEEQAERLGINIKEQFGKLALGSQSPIRLGERCTVFMESDLLSYQQQRAETDDLVAGLCYSIVSNYVNRVVGHRRIGERIFFQGGTAFNLGVVSAFEQVTGRKITVPPHHEVTGSIGAAVLARRHQEATGATESRFGGFELAETDYTIRPFECEECSNNCEINEVTVAGRDPLYYGSRCDRYNVKKESDDAAKVPNLFAQRHRLMMKHANLKKEKIADRPTVGIPLALSNYQLLPFWGTLLGELNVNVALSKVSTQETIHRGVAAVLSTPCFPVKVAHGHVLELIDKGVDYIWMPSVVSMTQDSEENPHNQLCPYVTSIPYQVAAAIEPKDRTLKMLKPAVEFQEGRASLCKSLRLLCDELGVSKRQLRQAIDHAWQAQDDFEEACREAGREVLDNLKPNQRAVVVVSRPYNGCDPGVSLDLPGKLRKLDVLPIPMDFLDLRPTGPTGDQVFQNMYWKYGQRILHAGRIIREDPRLHAIYLSNFSCGPDSFIIGFFKRLMAPKPALVLEVDEHSAGAGVITRLEAFLESLAGAPPIEISEPKKLYPEGKDQLDGRTVYIHWMGDISHALAAGFRGSGISAEVLPMADQGSIELGRRHLSGKECLPCTIMAGDIVRQMQKKGTDPKKAAFFLPTCSGPCRYGQYHCVHKLVLDDLGYGDVPMISPSQNREFFDECKEIQGGAMRLTWMGSCAVDLLLRACLAIRPYETRVGQTDEVYRRCCERVVELTEKRSSVKQLRQCMQWAADQFARIDADRTHRRPKIGVLGEIYVRHHDFSNNNVLRQLEEIGAETTLAGFPEWMYYTNWARKNEARRDRRWRQWLTNAVEDYWMHRVHRQLSTPFDSLVGPLEVSPIEEVLKLADPYIHRTFLGEAVLSVGRMIELCHEGCDGVVNVMPFSCMPSTIVGGVMKKLTVALREMPTLSISYDGQQDPMLHTRLEAFVYQAQAYQTARDGHGPHHDATRHVRTDVTQPKVQRDQTQASESTRS